MKYLLSDKDALLANPADIGGKAFSLARLTASDFPVPSWAVLPATAWLLFSDRLKVPDIRTLTEVNAASASAELSRQIESADLPPAITDAIREWTEAHRGYCAVRSSVSGEDSDQHSFAGQMESFLFQRGMEQLVQSVKKCWSSAFSERALLYRVQNRIVSPILPSVIIQEMIDSDVSGVLFTVHPLTANRKQMLLTAAPGLGEGIVSGLVNTDEYTLDLDGHIDKKIAVKDVKIVLDASAQTGTVKLNVDPATASQPCLTNEQIGRIGAIGKRIALHFGKPMDIEWAIQGTSIYILQARPITGIAPMPFGRKQVWDNSNIQESFCGVTTPMTFSFAQLAYATVYEQTMRLVRLPERTIEEHRDMLQSMLGLIGGRIYYNINNWYRGLLLLPSFKTNKRDMERMMGLTEPVDFIVDHSLTGWAKLRQVLRLTATSLRLLYEFSRIEHSVKQFHTTFRLHERQVRSGNLQEYSLEELIGLIDNLRDKVLKRWQPAIINDFYVMMYSGKVRRWLEGLPDPDLIMNGLLAGEPELASSKPTKELAALADIVRNDTALKQLVTELEPQHILEAARQAHPEFADACIRFIGDYGDRVMGELKLETKTLRQDASFMFLVLKNYLNHPAWDFERELHLRKEAESTAAMHVRSRHGWWSVRRFQKHLNRYRIGVRQRESTRLERTRLFGMVREILLQIGEQLAITRLIGEPRDIFYLTLEELEQWSHGRLVMTRFSEIVHARKLEFATYEEWELPNRIETFGPVYHFNRLEQSDTRPPASGTDYWKGLGCYPGVVEGVVRRIMDPGEAADLKGNILVTLRTDPGWTPLFPSCKGVVVERGSSLSHSAVIARELAIPTIVAVADISKILKTGERIRMDGGTGEIWRL